MNPFDVTAILAGILAAAWLAGRLQSVGMGTLLATAVALASLWLVGSAVSAVQLGLGHAWLRLSDSAPALTLVLVAAVMTAVAIFGGRLIWSYWQARRYFDL